MIEHRVTANFNKGVKVDAEFTFVSITISSFYIPRLDCPSLEVIDSPLAVVAILRPVNT